MKKLIATFIVFILTLGFWQTSFANESLKKDSVSITTSYAYATTRSAQTGAVFITNVSNTGEPRSIISASSSYAERVELHTMSMDDGIMTMRESENGFTIPAKKNFNLNKNGDHFMLMQLKQPLQKGDQVDLKIVLNDSTEILIHVPIMSVGDAQKLNESH